MKKKLIIIIISLLIVFSRIHAQNEFIYSLSCGNDTWYSWFNVSDSIQMLINSEHMIDKIKFKTLDVNKKEEFFYHTLLLFENKKLVSLHNKVVDETIHIFSKNALFYSWYKYEERKSKEKKNNYEGEKLYQYLMQNNFKIINNIVINGLKVKNIEIYFNRNLEIKKMYLRNVDIEKGEYSKRRKFKFKDGILSLPIEEEVELDKSIQNCLRY